MFSKLKKLVKDCLNNNKLCTLSSNVTNSLKHMTKSNLCNFFNYSFSKLRNNIEHYKYT
jgi:hypothetical protein